MATVITTPNAPIDASYGVISSSGVLTAERVLTGTSNQVTLTDGGANSTLTFSLPQNIHTAATPTFSNLTLSSHTSGRLFYSGIGGVLTSAATGTFAGTQLGLSTSGTSGGVLLGTDALLYRRTTDTMALGSGDYLEVPSGLSVGTTASSTVLLNMSKTVSADASNFGIQFYYTVNTAQTLGTTNYIMNVAAFINAPIQPSPSSYFVGGNYEVYLQSGTGNNHIVYGGNFRVRAAAGLTGGTTNNLIGGLFSAWNDAATGVTITNFVGGKFDAITTAAAAAGTITSGIGGHFRFGSIHASSTTVWTSLYGLYLEGYNGGAGAITDWYGIYALDANAIGSGATKSATWIRLNTLLAFSANTQTRVGIQLEGIPDPGAFTGTTSAAIWLGSDTTPTTARNGIWWGRGLDFGIFRTASAAGQITGTCTVSVATLTPIVGSPTTGVDLLVRGFDLLLSTGTNVLVRGGNGAGSKGGIGGNATLKGGTGATPGTARLTKVDGTTKVIEVNETGVGFFAAVPVAQSTGWAMSNVTTDKVLDCNATSIDEVADVLATLIDYLKTTGILAA